MRGVRFVAAMVVLSALACGGDPSATTGADQDVTSGAALEKTAKSLTVYWFEKGTIANIASANGSLSKAPGDGSDSSGQAGFHVYQMDNADDGLPFVDVTSSSFQPYLVIKQRDCASCTAFVAGTKTASGWEIKHAGPKNGSQEGPIAGAHDTGHFELFVTSVDNLNASKDLHAIGKAVTDGSYTLTTTLE
jgi:hypothetical protein